MIPLGFLHPIVLTALLTLPAIWWLLRMTPPRPRLERFPPTRLLLDIARREETPVKSPWWLTALRLALTAFLVIALAGPVWRPAAERYPGKGPLLLVIDNGWLAATDWQARKATAERVIAAAETAARPIMLLPSATLAPDLSAIDAATARRRLAALEPQPFTPDRAALLPAIEGALAARSADIVWISDAHENGSGREFAATLARLAGGRRLEIVTDSDRAPLGLKIIGNTHDALEVTIVRGKGGGPRRGSLRARDLRGRPIAEAAFALREEDTATTARFTLPVELRNEITRLEIVAERSAGAVQLLDQRWRRRLVGIVSGESNERAQPLLSPLYYVEKALAPYADLRRPRASEIPRAIAELVEENVSAIIMTDIGNLTETAARPLAEWVEGGGVLIRFAGPRLAAGDDPLVPVRLRRGGRILGGSLSWERPQRLAPFRDDTPFAGLTVTDDIRIVRQVLAEPGPDIAERSYASLADGTPLVTAARRGAGLVILFHVTADTTWSNLPLSGTFVEMLRRLVALSPGSIPAGTGAGAGTRDLRRADDALLPPFRLLDGYGAFTAPPPTAQPLPVSQFDGADPEVRHPPGFYGSKEAFRALNLLGAEDLLAALDLAGLPGIDAVRPLSAERPRDLRPWLFLLALALLSLDLLAVLPLNGRFRRWSLKPSGSAGLFLLAALLPASIDAGTAFAGQDGRNLSAADLAAIRATDKTRLAYVVTGNPRLDETSRAGLAGLTRALARRTALEPGEPVGLDIARDELTFFALIYWPIDPQGAPPPADVMARIDAFMKNGGTVLFDSRDGLRNAAGLGDAGGTPGRRRLRRILASLDIPPLAVVPPDHVLTRSFYLLDDFPGRYRDGRLWVEALPQADDDTQRPARSDDGVSSILITSNDFAAAWAVDESGAPLYPTIPDDPLQREFAFRAGINIVMYVLTGNYKADQVHLPALLERLGQ